MVVASVISIICRNCRCCFWYLLAMSGVDLDRRSISGDCIWKEIDDSLQIRGLVLNFICFCRALFLYIILWLFLSFPLQCGAVFFHGDCMNVVKSQNVKIDYIIFIKYLTHGQNTYVHWICYVWLMLISISEKLICIDRDLKIWVTWPVFFLISGLLSVW